MLILPHLQGLAFMHSKGVAHRDCSAPNIMMDATNMYPLGFHPVRDRFLNDVSTPAPVIPRSELGVKYYFVDFGISSYFPPGSQRELVLGTAGRDQDVPELSDEVPYDPFKVDIFTIGNVFRQTFYEVRPLTCQNPLSADGPSLRNIPIALFLHLLSNL